MKSLKKLIHLTCGPGMEARVLKRAILRVSASRPDELAARRWKNGRFGWCHWSCGRNVMALGSQWLPHCDIHQQVKSWFQLCPWNRKEGSDGSWNLASVPNITAPRKVRASEDGFSTSPCV
jgi:hypothetical protein